MGDVPTGGSGAATVNAVVTCFLRHRGDVLLVRRSSAVGSYRGRWGAVSGFCEAEDALDDALREIAEETGLGEAVRLVRRGEPFTFTDEATGRSWRVHPFLFDAERRDAELDWEAEEGAWVAPTEILERACVPRLWSSYRQVAPTLATVRDDREHGAAYLSLRALEVLRDRAAELAHGVGAEADVREDGGAPLAELVELAGALQGARPAMAAVGNRVRRALELARSPADGATLAAAGTEVAGHVAAAAQRVLEDALEAEDAVVRRAAELLAGKGILTLSLSGTVARALSEAVPPPARAVVLESRPGSEGRVLAGRLARAGVPTVLVPDAAVAWAIERYRPDLVLLGADSVLPDGSVVNKVGTRPAALAAREAGVRVLAVATRDKVAQPGIADAAADEGAVADPDGEAAAGGAPWRSPLFERTPASLLDGIVTEAGVLSEVDIAALSRDGGG